jgi:hypothetical protein
VVDQMGAVITLSTNAETVAEIYLAAMRKIKAATPTGTQKQTDLFQFFNPKNANDAIALTRRLLTELDKVSRVKGVPADFTAGLVSGLQRVLALSPAVISALSAEAAAGNKLAQSLLRVSEALNQVNRAAQISRVQQALPAGGARSLVPVGQQVLPAGGRALTHLTPAQQTLAPTAITLSGIQKVIDQYGRSIAGAGIRPGGPPPPGGPRYGYQFGPFQQYPPGGGYPPYGGFPPRYPPPPPRPPYPPYGFPPGQGGGGGGGGGGAAAGAAAGFMGGRGSLLDQLKNTARITLLYGSMYQALFGLEKFLSGALSSFSEFQIALQELAESAGVSVSEARNMAETITDIGAAFGAAATDALHVAIQARGVNPEGGEAFVNEAVRTASQLALITGQSATEIGQSLNGLTVAFDTSQKIIGDASTYFNKKYGVLQPTLAGEARVGPLAAQAGLKPEELSAIFSALSARLAETPDALAASLTQVLSRPDLVDLTQFGATAGKSFADQVEEVGKQFNSMSKQTQNELIFQFGRGKSGQAALELFRNFPAIRQQVKEAGPSIAGKAEEIAQRRMTTFAGAMQHLQVQVQNLANAFGQAGLLNPIIVLVKVLTELIDVFNSLLGPLTRLPEPIKSVVAGMIELAIALRLAKFAMGSGLVAKGSQFLAGLTYGPNVAAGTTGVLASIRGGLVKMGPSLLAATKALGPFTLAAAAVTGTVLAINAVQEATLAEKAARDSLKVALADETLSTKELADAAQASADALEDHSAVTRLLKGKEITDLQNTADVLQSISDIKPAEATQKQKDISAVLSSSGIDAAMDALEKMGITGDAAIRTLAAAASATGKVPESAGGGVTERTKRILQDLVGNLPKLGPEDFYDPSKLKGGEKPPAGFDEYTDYLNDVLTGASLKPPSGEAKEKFTEYLEKWVQSIVPGVGASPEHIMRLVERTMEAQGMGADDPGYEQLKKLWFEFLTTKFKGMAALGNSLDEITAAKLSEIEAEITRAKGSTARTNALFKRGTVGPNLSFSPGEAKTAFAALAAGDRSVLQPSSLVNAQMKKLQALQDAINLAQSSGEWDRLEQLFKDEDLAKEQLASALIEPAMSFLNAAFGDLTTKDKSNAEIQQMVSSIASLIPLVYSSGDAMATLVASMDSATRNLVRAKIASNKKIADTAIKGAIAGLDPKLVKSIVGAGVNLTASKSDLEILARGGGFSPLGGIPSSLYKGKTQSEIDKINRTIEALAGQDTQALVDLFEDQANLNDQLKAFDLAISGAATGPGVEKATKEKKPKEPRKLDTAAQIAAAKALAEATRVADPVKIAAAQVQVAMADLDAAARDTENGGKNSVAYYNALAGVYQAQQNLANTIVQASHQVRLLGIDLTDPVQQAKAEYQLAVDNLNSLMSQGLSENALNPAKVDVRQKEAALQAAKFQQMFGDLQTNEQLKRISHQEFIRSVQAERDRLAAQRSLLSASSNMYRQLTDEINQLDQALMEASESMNTMFNLGAIKIPTVYEVRRFMDSAFEGMNFLAAGMQDQMRPGGGVTPAAAQVGAVDNRNVVININGGDLNAVQAAVMDAAGVDQQVVGARPHKF